MTEKIEQVKEENTNIDYSILIKYVPIGGILLILLSALKLILFYKAFNIDITSYVNIQEYIPLFIDDVFAYSITFGTILIYITSRNSRALKFKRNNKGFNAVYSLMFFFLAFLAANLLVITWNIINVSITLNLVLLLILVLMLAVYKKKKDDMDFLFFFVTMFLIYHCFSPVVELSKIIGNKEKSSYTITLKNEKITTDSIVHYLGKTLDYTFLYNTETKTSRVLKNENIIEVLIRPKIKDVKIKEEKVEKLDARQRSPIMKEYKKH